MKYSSKIRKLHLLYRVVAVVLTASLLILSLPFSAYAKETGSCGSDITWTLEKGILTLSGNGSMTDFEETNMPPWYDRREEILSVVIEDGINTIGKLAFYECTTLQSITLPDSVKSIGDMAFARCFELKRVNLGKRLVSIGEKAFSMCENLQSIRLPKGLLSIQYQAFYACKSLVSIRVPATVSIFEESIFAHCESLTQATIECNLLELPMWTFYGCTSLVDVSLPSTIKSVGEYAFFDCNSLEKVIHEGKEEDRETVSEQIKNEVPDFSEVTEDGSISSTTSESTTTDENGSTIETDKEVIETEDTTVNIEVNHTKPSTGKDSYDITIDVTIDSEDGWDEMMDYADSYIKYPDRLSDDDTTVNDVALNVNLNSGTKLPSQILGSLAGHKVDLSISTGTNENWTINCENLVAEDLSGSYNLGFTITKIENPTKAQKKLYGNSTAYNIKFKDEIPFEITIKVPLGYSYANHYATLCQKPVLKGWEILQSVVIDRKGLASFYLSSVDRHTQYMVVIDMQGIDAADILIPESMMDEYGGLTDEEGNKYVITGTESSWGISFGQLTIIIFGIIIIAAVMVGSMVKLQFKLTANRKRIEKQKRE